MSRDLPGQVFLPGCAPRGQELREYRAETKGDAAAEAERALSAAHALLRRLVEANGEQDYGIVAKARKLLALPDSPVNHDPDSEHYHE